MKKLILIAAIALIAQSSFGWWSFMTQNEIPRTNNTSTSNSTSSNSWWGGNIFRVFMF